MPATRSTDPEGRPRRAGGARRLSSAQIQERIDLAAEQVLAAEGVDGLGLTRVADVAELSNGPLYGRYDSAEDIALDLWDRTLRDHGARLQDAVDAYLFGDDPTVPDALIREFTAPSAASIGFAEVLAVARRFPILAETVRTDVEARLATTKERFPDVPDTLLGAAAMLPVGIALLRDVIPGAPTRWERALELGRELFQPDTDWRIPDRDVPPLAVERPNPTTGDELLDGFVLAIMDVVSKVGYERATAHRIGRAAGRSFSSAYALVTSKDELMALAIGATLTEAAAIGDVTLLGLADDEYIDAVCALWSGFVDDANRSIRHLRIESFLAAAHHADLGERMRASYQVAIDAVTAALGTDDPSLIERRLAFWQLTRAVGTGLTILSINSPVLQRVNWAQYSCAAMLLNASTLPR